MSKPKILFQLDPAANASTFDSVVAIDSGIDHLVHHSHVTIENIEGLVHGAMFTRGPDDLKSTALFFGGDNVEQTEKIVERAIKCFFGPMRVSLMVDPNGSNTTAAAAVLSAEKHVELAGKTVTILAGTGPVGQRIAQIIAHQTSKSGSKPATIRLCSRKHSKADEVCGYLKSQCTGGRFEPTQTADANETIAAIAEAEIIFAAGAAGIELLPESWQLLGQLPSIAIDLNAVPPAGIFGIDVMDKGTERRGAICYGAIGVGGLKMKIHKRSLASLFESNQQVLQVHEIYEIGKSL